MDLKLLGKKFAEEDLEWRIQMNGKGKQGDYALVVPYITNRAIMQRLDEACGLGNWKNEYIASPCNTGYLCGISIKIGNEWVTRWDGSEVTGGGTIDKVKSTLSTSMKRTGVQWGIGRYLYQFETGFATVKPVDFRNNTDTANGFMFHENKKKQEKFQWRPPAVPAWALPFTEKDIVAHVDAIENSENNNELRMIWQESYKIAVSEDDDGMMRRFEEAKENTKKALEEKAEKAKAIREAEIDGLVIKHITIIKSAVNESAAKGLVEVAIAEVKTIARGDKLKQAMKEIKAALLKESK